MARRRTCEGGNVARHPQPPQALLDESSRHRVQLRHADRDGAPRFVGGHICASPASTWSLTNDVSQSATRPPSEGPPGIPLPAWLSRWTTVLIHNWSPITGAIAGIARQYWTP